MRSTGTELAGKTLGIVGSVRSASSWLVAPRALITNVIAYDPYIQEGYCAAHGIGIRTLDATACEANVITLHLPLNNQTHHIIGQVAIAQMQPGTILVNASRGALIDEDAAYDALCSGQLGGLGLDAFEREPPTGSKLLTLDSVVATPHDRRPHCRGHS
ncbi:MAG: NAD(P)-dependent oxidoreductase [Oscillospiraceae bacterium]